MLLNPEGFDNLSTRFIRNTARFCPSETSRSSLSLSIYVVCDSVDRIALHFAFYVLQFNKQRIAPSLPLVLKFFVLSTYRRINLSC